MKRSRSLNGDAGGNLAGIPRFEPGEGISAGALNRIAERQNAAIASSPSGEWHQTPYGNIVSGGSRRARAISADHPFKVIPASDEFGPKVRILPGLVNTGFATVDGFANEFTDPADHLANAPRLAITSSLGYVAIHCTGLGTLDGVALPVPASADLVYLDYAAYSPAGDIAVAKVEILASGALRVYQLRRDCVNISAGTSVFGDPFYMLT